MQEKELEQANLHAIPISNVGMAIASANGAKNPKSEWFNPYQHLLKPKEKGKIVDTFNYLLKKGLIPSWVIPQVDFLD